MARVRGASAPALLHMAVLRSEVASALVESVQSARAVALPGMAAVMTGEVVAECSRTLGNGWDEAIQTRKPLICAMAVDKVRYTGQPLAATLALSQDLAERSLALITPHLQPLPSVLEVQAAVAADAPLLYDSWGENVQARLTVASGDAEAVLGRAEVVLSDQAVDVVATAERRQEELGAVFWYDAHRATLTMQCATGRADLLQRELAGALALPSSSVELVTPTEEDSDGTRSRPLFPEDVLAGIFAIQLGYPVRWEPRSSGWPAGSVYQAVRETTVGVDRQGLVLALKSRTAVNVGAYLQCADGSPFFATHLVPPMAHPPVHYQNEVCAVVTNAPPLGLYQTVSAAPGAATERLAAMIAYRLGLTSDEVIRRNEWCPPAADW